MAARRNLDGAIAEYRQALKLDPKLAPAHNNLASALADKGDAKGAIEEYHKTVALDPGNFKAHFNLGTVLDETGNLDAAINAYRKAIQLKADLAEAHDALRIALTAKGRFADALVHIRRAHELAAKNPRANLPSAEDVKKSERLVELDAKLVRVLKGEIQPVDAVDQLLLAQMCQKPGKALYAAAVRFYAAAFADQPKWEADRQFQFRYKAACAAALAGTADAAKEPATEADKAALRHQARDWLQADLDAYAGQVKAGSAAAIPLVEARLAHWQADRDFVGVRDAQALARFPDAEQAEWRKLWGDVDQLLKQARSLITTNTLTGTLTDQQPEQVHELKMQAGKTYVIDMTSKPLDSYVKLYDPAGKLVAENDDIAPNILDARISFTPKSTGVYRITATSFEQRGRGAYTLTIRAVGK